MVQFSQSDTNFWTGHGAQWTVTHLSWHETFIAHDKMATKQASRQYRTCRSPTRIITPGKSISCAHLIGGWLGPGASLNAVAKRKIRFLCRE